MAKYLTNFLQPRSALLLEMEAYAKENHVPIMALDGIATMIHLMKMAGAKSVLEIGMAIGYSSLRMAEAIEGVSVVTIERDMNVIPIAKQYMEQAGRKNQITIVEGDALYTESEVVQYAPFDCIFIDAAKGQYQRFFEMYEKFLSPGGVIFTDNVLFQGLLEKDTEEIETTRIKRLVTKIDRYNHWLFELDHFATVILPVGDGLAVSHKV